MPLGCAGGAGAGSTSTLGSSNQPSSAVVAVGVAADGRDGARAGRAPPLNLPTFKDVAARRAAARVRTYEMPAAPSPLQLPAPADMGKWLASLAQRDSVEDIMRAMYFVCPHDEIYKACDTLLAERFGPSPAFDVPDDAVALASTAPGLARPGLGCGSPLLPVTSTGTRQQRKRPLSADIQPANVFMFKRCEVCEPSAFGSSDKPCEALALLGSIQEDLEMQVQSVGQAEAEHGVSAELRKSARYYMYRKYVYMAFGVLGAGTRVRIPLCVVENIRDEFRAPGCDCAMGGPLAKCKQHGYTGHRDSMGGGM